MVEAEIGPTLVVGVEQIDGFEYRLVDTGNPHAVRVVDDPGAIDVAVVGPVVARVAGFDGGCNVEFISLNGDEVTMRVWERGVGETLACGTGMVAAAAVALDGTDGRVEVHVPGGSAQVVLKDKVGWLIGPAEYAFTGIFDQG
jgi:diaminopimelate epimerase